MGLIGLFLASNILAAQLFVCLRSAEQVSSQLGAAHVIKNLFVFLETFTSVDFFCAEASVQSLIAVILENGEIIGLDNASLLRRFGQGLVVRFHFFADGKPLLILGQLIVVVDQLLLARLYGEVGLSNCNDLLARVAIHNDQVAGIAGENVVINQLNTTVRHGRCFVDLNKTFIHSYAAVFAGCLSFFNEFLEIPPFRIFKYGL